MSQIFLDHTKACAENFRNHGRGHSHFHSVSFVWGNRSCFERERHGLGNSRYLAIAFPTRLSSAVRYVESDIPRAAPSILKIYTVDASHGAALRDRSPPSTRLAQISGH